MKFLNYQKYIRSIFLIKWVDYIPRNISKLKKQKKKIMANMWNYMWMGRMLFVMAECICQRAKCNWIFSGWNQPEIFVLKNGLIGELTPSPSQIKKRKKEVCMAKNVITKYSYTLLIGKTLFQLGACYKSDMLW